MRLSDEERLSRKLRATKHDMVGTPEYNAWQNAKARCYRKSHKRYPEWGGRGITMCEEWKSDFSAFFRDVGPRPSDRHTLDRENNDKGYEPGNAKWVTFEEQASNRPGFVREIHFQGKTQNLSQWARELGMHREKLKYRLDKGWPMEVACIP